MDNINDQINEAVKESCKQARDLSGKDYGVINIVVNDINVKHSIPKEVIWDEEELEALWSNIEDAGDEPDDFINKKVSYSIPEMKYKEMPKTLQKVFDKARTVKQGKISVTLSMDEYDNIPF